MTNSVFQQHYEDEDSSDKLSRKAKDSPFMIFGLVGLAAVCGLGIYKYKRRGEMSTSVFLMQLRVAAQGTVVGALSIGLAYSMVQKYVLHSDDHSLPAAPSTSERTTYHPPPQKKE